MSEADSRMTRPMSVHDLIIGTLMSMTVMSLIPVSLAEAQGSKMEAPHIAAVPLVKLVVDRMPIRLDPKEPGTGVLLDMDVQSTGNRTSSQPGL